MRGALILVLVAACGGGSGADPDGTDCKDGETRDCYSGPDGTEGVGPCHGGLEVCSAGRWPGICIGDQTPLFEQCNMLDDDCDGTIDNAPGVNEACNGSNGCTGVKMCDDKGKIRCFAPSKNECDVCGGPDVTNLGDDCMANTCVGAFVCTLEGTASTCMAPSPNECGTCGGPAVTGLNIDCMSADNCPGTMVCDDAGVAAVCNAPMKNECDACFASVGTIGTPCTADHGCVGLSACNGAGDAAVCNLDSGCGHLVISEISTGTTVCAADEYIELYNPTPRAISLTGYSVRYRATSGNFTKLVTFGPGKTIASHGFYLLGSANNTDCAGGYVGNTANTVTADSSYTANMSASTASVWLLTKDQDPTGLTDTIVVDVVGYGSKSSNVYEGTDTIAAPAKSSAVERKAYGSSTAVSMASGGADVNAGNGYDSDDNSLDFVTQTARVPQNTSSTPEP